MKTFFIVTKIITSILGVIWNSFMWVINGVISLINKYIRERNDRIKRGVIELKSATIDDIYPISAPVKNIIVSGSFEETRVEFLSRYVVNASNEGFATIILHEGNKLLSNALKSAIGDCYINIDENSPIFEPFEGKSTRDICKLINEVATDEYDLKKNCFYHIEALCKLLSFKGIKPTLKAFQTCPHSFMYDKISNMVTNGKISSMDGQELQSKIMMGQSEQYKLETLFNDWYEQSEAIIPKTKGINVYSITKAIKERKIISIDISSNVNVLLINSIIAEITQAISKGNKIVLILDNLTTSGNEKVKKIVSRKTDKCIIAFCGDDLLSICDGDDKLFNTVVGNAEQIAILGHSSGATCTKWAETVGYYEKDEESQSYQNGKMRHSPFLLFPGSNNSTTKNYNKKREYIVKPEEINRMRYNELYYYDHINNKLVHTYLQ